MSTISTHLNWGSSYVVNDFYLRFLRKNASGKEQVAIGRISTVLMMVFAGALAFVLEEAREGFDLLLSIGAGTGLLFILRWFWHRINPYSEIAAMLISFLIAAFFFVNGKMEAPLVQMEGHWQLVLSVAITTLGWVLVTLLTKPSKPETLHNFNHLIFGNESKFKGFGMKILGFFAGVVGVYCSLFAIGNIIYGKTVLATGLTFVAALCGWVIFKSFQKTG
jgi:Na+/proline symporter